MPISLQTPGLDPETRRQLEQLEENKHEAEQDRLIKVLQADDKSDDEKVASLVKLLEGLSKRVLDLANGLKEAQKPKPEPKKTWLAKLLNL